MIEFIINLIGLIIMWGILDRNGVEFLSRDWWLSILAVVLIMLSIG